jgi:cytochrome b561
VMLRVEPGALQNVLFNVHKNIGLVIFVLALVRVGWRLVNPVPSLPLDVPGWQARIAHSTHFLLYALLFSLPISGFLYTAFGGFPVPLLMIWDLGALVPASKPQAEVWQAIHFWSQWALYLVVALHVAGALQHHFVRDDEVLRRMLTTR